MYFIKSHSVLIEREWDENFKFVKVGNIKQLVMDKENCEKNRKSSYIKE